MSEIPAICLFEILQVSAASLHMDYFEALQWEQSPWFSRVLKPPNDHIVRFNLSHKMYLLATKYKIKKKILFDSHYSKILYSSLRLLLFDQLMGGKSLQY